MAHFDYAGKKSDDERYSKIIVFNKSEVEEKIHAQNKNIGGK